MADTKQVHLVEFTDVIRSTGINMDRTSRTVGSLHWRGIELPEPSVRLQNTKVADGAVKDDSPISFESSEL